MALDLGALAPLLARDLSTIEDPPSFKTPPEGVYKWKIEKIESKPVKTKEGKDVTTIQLRYIITDIVEQKDKEVDPVDQVKPGDIFGESFWFSDPERLEETISYLKQRFEGLAEVCGSTDLLEIMGKAEGMLVQGIIGHRMDKTDKTKIYPTIRDVVPAT